MKASRGPRTLQLAHAAPPLTAHVEAQTVPAAKQHGAAREQIGGKDGNVGASLRRDSPDPAADSAVEEIFRESAERSAVFSRKGRISSSAIGSPEASPSIQQSRSSPKEASIV